MKDFMGTDFLLDNETARRLYHEVAAAQPIFDYHCHLAPKEIAENKRFANLADVWLGGDHYKWRLMRSNGVDERYITGDAEPYEKFLAWTKTIQRAIGNPLYHWSHLELRRYFGIHEALNENTAPLVWEKANARLAEPELSVSGIFKGFSVYAVGTTDDPADSLEWHKAIKAAGAIETKVLPSFRPDKAIHLDKPGYSTYIETLGKAADVKISCLDDLLEALRKRVDYFDKLGCRASDHALEYPPCRFAKDGSSGSAWQAEADASFKAALDGASLGKPEADAFKTFVLVYLGKLYAERAWAMQLHLAAIRNNNGRMMKVLGPDSGYDAVNDQEVAAALAGLLNVMEERGELPRTILYSLNPKDYYSLGTLMGCFQGDIPGKIQLGSAWWFCDHRDGMTEQLKVLGNLGLLSRFIGMLTDSRSFLSYPRHEYFRRILCSLIGSWAEAGEIPDSRTLLDQIVADISFGNARRYFEG